jgi:hypothetical protein
MAEVSGERFSFILANPLEFPARHPPLQAWMSPSKKFVNLLEDVFDSADRYLK